ncbi:SAM-dependent methyltransferase, partial [Selenomonas sp. oral taxon 126]
MQLDARLAAIAAFVPHGTVLADIGGDHAYLAATLVMEGIAPRAVVG